jgi:predicted MFS family arabinose efflux permease
VRGRVFGVLEGLAVGAVGVGSALGGILITGLGVRGALLVAAAIPVLGVLAMLRPSPRSGCVARPGAMDTVTKIA